MLWSYVAFGTFGHDLNPTAGLCQPTSRPRRYSADAARWLRMSSGAALRLSRSMRQQNPDGLWLARDGGPQELTVCYDRCNPLGLQPHRVAAIWRELVHGVQVALTHEDETPACHAGEAHSSESDLGVAAGVVRRDDLIGGQRHSEPARE